MLKGHLREVSRVGAQLDVSQFDSDSEGAVGLKFVVDLHVDSDKHMYYNKVPVIMQFDRLPTNVSKNIEFHRYLEK